jgi:multiple sugar transport system substrate-binding protein
VRQQEVLALSTRSDSLDVMPCGADWLTSMLGAGDGLVDIGKLAAEDGWSSDAIMPGMYNLFDFKGTQYGVPARMSTYVLTYREDLLKAAGFSEPPKTWTEFNTMAKALTDPSKNQYGAGIAMAQVSLMVESWQSVVVSNGGTFVSTDGKLTLDSPAVVEATQMIADWLKDGLVPPDSLQFSDTEMITAMQQGRVAMGVIGGAWFSRISDPEASDFADQWRIAPRMPSGGSGNGQTLVTGWGLCINPASKHIKEAWDYIKFTVSDETQLYLAVEKNNAPVTSATYQDQTYLAARPQALNMLSAASDGHPAAEQVNGWSDVQLALQAGLSAIYAGDVTAAKGLGTANKDLQKFLS